MQILNIIVILKGVLFVLPGLPWLNLSFIINMTLGHLFLSIVFIIRLPVKVLIIVYLDKYCQSLDTKGYFVVQISNLCKGTVIDLPGLARWLEHQARYPRVRGVSPIGERQSLSVIIDLGNVRLTSGPYFSYFSLLFDPEPYFSLLFEIQPYYSYFFGVSCCQIKESTLKTCLITLIFNI